MIFTLDIADFQKVGDGLRFFSEDDENITLYTLQNGNCFQAVFNKVDVPMEEIIMWRERYLDRAIKLMAVEKEIAVNLNVA